MVAIENLDRFFAELAGHQQFADVQDPGCERDDLAFLVDAAYKLSFEAESLDWYSAQYEVVDLESDLCWYE